VYGVPLTHESWVLHSHSHYQVEKSLLKDQSPAVNRVCHYQNSLRRATAALMRGATRSTSQYTLCWWYRSCLKATPIAKVAIFSGRWQNAARTRPPISCDSLYFRGTQSHISQTILCSSRNFKTIKNRHRVKIIRKLTHREIVNNYLVKRMEKIRNAYKILVLKPKGRDYFGA
jgi:hypothetical protein